MKKKLFFLLAISILLGCGKKETNLGEQEEPDGTETSIKVMTYNIWGARSGGIPNLEELAEVIKRANPDVVALQEVDKNTTRNAKHGDIAKKLGELTGMDHFFAKAENFHGGEYGDAVLSKLPIIEKKAFNLEIDPALGGERRAVARIKLEKDGKSFYFISTHFDHLSDERNRIKQARDFVELARGFDAPVIAAGDFNALPTSQTIDILRTYFSLGCLNSNCTQFTFPVSSPNRTIDYIFYAPLNAFSTQLYSVYTWASKESDHFPVLATFKIN